jgi:hypothetical protein
VPNRPKPDEATDVKAALTVADTASQEALLALLHDVFPAVSLEAEEDTPSVNLFPTGNPSIVVIDPIDGTLRFYLEARGPYSVILGLATDHVYQAGLVALPREDLFFRGTRGGGAESAVGDGPFEPTRAIAEGSRVLVSHDLPKPAVSILEEAGLEVAPASGGAISVAPLLPGVRAGLRWVGNGSVSIRGRVGALISREAGALVRGEGGADFPNDTHTPARALLLAAEAADLEVLERAAEAAADSSA